MTSKQIRVSPNENNGRRVHKSGSIRDSIHTQTKKQAVDAAKQIAKNQKSELIIQKSNGKIEQRNSYGRDPFPPRDRN